MHTVRNSDQISNDGLQMQKAKWYDNILKSLSATIMQKIYIQQS